MSAPRWREARVGGCLAATIEQREGGVCVLRSSEALGAYPARLTDRLEHWARIAPTRTLAARRDNGGDWVRITYAQMLERAQRIGQALATRQLSVERPVAILSDNDLEHLSLALGCQWVGVPYVPISPAYSLMSQDHAKLRQVLASTTPGLVFASGPAYAAAIDATVGAETEVVLGHGELPRRASTRFTELMSATPGALAQAAHAQVGPDTIAKILFTSGSTLAPKGVITTQRMLCANQQMLAQSFAFLQDEPPVLVDWLPWNHTFGGSHNVGLVIYNGGTLHIDEGRPTPAGIGVTLRNLREISPTVYFNVPKGFEAIARAMDDDAALCESLLRRVKAFMFAGAGLSQAVWDKLDAHAERCLGERIRMFTGLGMTETAPTCTLALGTDVRAGHIGLPCPGVLTKLVPLGEAAAGKSEIRFKGPHVMPGYWREPALSAAAFDEEGFYRSGDAARFVDAAAPARGLIFDGRVAEDFKLSSGTFVSVGPLRARIALAGAPLILDAMVAAPDRDEVAVLLFPQLDACRRVAGLSAQASTEELLAHPRVREHFQSLVDRLWAQGGGSASRISRACLLAEPPAIDRGELTDKGTISQRAVMSHRAALVDALYAGTAPHMFLPQT